MAKIFWDTSLFIYLFEEHPAFGDQVAQIRRRMLARGDRLFTSALTLGEILVEPVARGNGPLAGCSILRAHTAGPEHPPAGRYATCLRGRRRNGPFPHQ